MTDVAASVLLAVQAAQLALKVLYALVLTAWRYPPTCTLTNGTYYDFIIVGGGTAGSILANRLSANSSYSVLVIEAGGYPPLESEMAGVFPTLPSSDYDHNITSVNDSATAQYLQNSVIELTAGNMLGGSSSLDHMIHVHGDPHDFNNWATILNDSSWNYTNIQEYLKKQENLTDAGLLSSKYASLHGQEGYIKIKRQTSSANDGILAAAEELGHAYVADTTSTTSTLGITEPLFQIDDNVRQSNALAYLSPAKNRSNLYLSLYTTASKILFNGTTAIGVEVVDSSGDVYVLYVNKEVIVSAGTLNSPKLLMLSGIGPSAHLESFNIEVIADLPVGQNFQDHPSTAVVYQMETDSSTTAAVNPHEFPVPTTCLYGAINSTQLYPDYQDIILIFSHDSTALVQLCSNCFKFDNTVCNKWYAATAGRTTIFVVHNLMIPKSRGEILLASADYTVSPLVTTGMYTDSAGADLTLMTESLVAFNNFTTTTYFESVNATLVDLGICSSYTGTEYWECYAKTLSAGMWHYVGTCAMGSVVDTSLAVKNVTNLRVVDASVMPTEVSGNIKAAINMVAERAAAIILSKY